MAVIEDPKQINGGMRSTLFHLYRRIHKPWLSKPVRSEGLAYRSYSTFISSDSDEVKVKVGSSGHVALKYIPSTPKYPLLYTNIRTSLYRPPHSADNRSIILWLPRGLHLPSFPEPDSLSLLSLASNATIVRVRYRHAPYPGPIHDCLAGYDWVLKNLVRRTGEDNDHLLRPGIGVCGELVGGSLAAMLALTECQVGKSSISAAVIGNPIADWTGFTSPKEKSQLSEPIATSKRAAKPEPESWTDFADNNTMSTSLLLSLRQKFHPNPASQHDPFASPLLFFRTPSIELPSLFQVDETEPQSYILKRRSHRKYPPQNSNLRLPKLRVELGQESPLGDQGMEFAELAARSVGLHEYGDGVRDNEQRARERVEVVRRPGTGLWGNEELEQVGVWFANALR